MLSWKRVGDSWFGNGFRVQQVSTSQWTLEHVEVPVSVDASGPIAQLASLQACQHKAERLHHEARINVFRKRLAAVGVGGWALAALLGSPVGFIIGGVVGSAALLELGATWLDDRVGSVREFVQ